MRCVSHRFALLNGEEEAVSPHLQKVAALADVILYEDDHILVLNNLPVRRYMAVVV